MRANYFTAVSVLVVMLVRSQVAVAQTGPQLLISTAAGNSTQSTVNAGDVLTVETVLAQSNGDVSGLTLFLIFNPEYLEVFHPVNPDEPVNTELNVFSTELEPYYKGFGYGGIPNNNASLDNTTVQPSATGYGYIHQVTGNVRDPEHNIPDQVIPDGVISTFKLRVIKRPPEGVIAIGPLRSKFQKEKYIGLQTGYFVNEEAEVVRAFQTAPQLMISVHPLPEEIVSKSDFNGSGRVDFADFLTFVTKFKAGDLAVDLDASGSIDLSDFLAFREAYRTQ